MGNALNIILSVSVIVAVLFIALGVGLFIVAIAISNIEKDLENERKPMERIR